MTPARHACLAALLLGLALQAHADPETDTAVPEPESYALLLTGLGALAARRWRQI